MRHGQGPGRARQGPGRRAVLAAAGGAALTGALAACTDADGSSKVAETTPSGTAGAGRRIAQWYHAYSEAGTEAAVRRYAAAFPDAKVAVEWKQGNYDDDTAAALLFDNGPDVFEYANGPTIDMIRGGQVVDLTEVVGDASNAFQQSVIGRMIHEGRTWAIPQVVDTQVLVYRRSMLDKAGVAPPQTMDELLEACRRLTTKQVKGIFLGNRGGATHLGGPTLWSAGLDFLTDDNEFGFDEPRAGKAFAKLHQLFKEELVLPKARQEWYEPAALIDGQTAMQFTGLWTFPALTKELGDDFGVLPWPRLDDMGNPSVPLGAYGSCVSAKAEDLDAAKEFVRWLWVDQTSLQLDFATSYGLHIPAQTALIASADALRSGPAAEATAIAVEFGVHQSKMLWTPTCVVAFEEMMTAVVHGGDPATEIKKLREVVDAELKRVR